MKPIVRSIEPKDDAELGILIKSVLTEFNANKPGTAYYDESINHLSTVFTQPKSAYWVIEEDNKIIGGGGIFPTFGLPPETCELVKLYLYPSARGRGLGRLIMENCFKKASSCNFTNIYLESMPELNQAVSMYERLGFENLPCAIGNSGHFGCDIWMVKKL